MAVKVLKIIRQCLIILCCLVSIIVSGICHNVGIGSHTIQYSVGRCQGQSMDTDATTGWASSFTIVVEEVRVEELQTSCSGRPVTCS